MQDEDGMRDHQDAISIEMLPKHTRRLCDVVAHVWLLTKLIPQARRAPPPLRVAPASVPGTDCQPWLLWALRCPWRKVENTSEHTYINILHHATFSQYLQHECT